MGKITKDNKAITLVSLVLTIVILLILASVITYSAADSMKSAKVTEFISKMQLMQQKVDSFIEGKIEEEINNLSIENKVLTTAQTQVLQTAKNSNEINGEISDFIYFDKQELANQFDVEDIDDEYIINFKTREVVSVNGVEYEDKIYYTQYLLPNGQSIKQYNNTERELGAFNISYKIDGLNAKITVTNLITNGTLSYKEENDTYWNNVTNYTENDKEYTISIEKSGKYIIKIKDNISEKYKEADSIKIELINKPVLDGDKAIIESENNYDYSNDSSSWIYAQDSETGPYYVWVPKFAYRIVDEVPEKKFIRGTTNIGTDNTYINTQTNETEEIKWIISDKFNNLKGIWVQVENTNSDELDLIELINT